MHKFRDRRGIDVFFSNLAVTFTTPCVEGQQQEQPHRLVDPKPLNLQVEAQAKGNPSVCRKNRRAGALG